MKKTENEKVIFCKRCLYSSKHPLGITFNDQGICSGCEIHDEKYTLNWKYRWSKLVKITKEYKSKKNNYDCIVPISGAQDSYFTIHVIKKLGLNPLLVHYNKYFNTVVGIENLANLRIKFNCDIIFQNININSVKKITKKTLINFGNMYWPILAGQTVFPVQISTKYKIPLIIWGAHQGTEQVGMFSHNNEVEMSRRYRKNHDLFGFEPENLLETYDDLNEEDLHQYIYPSDHSLNQVGTRGIYLSNYMPWDPKTQHELMIKKYNYKTFKFKRTIDCYDHVDCHNYMNVHDYLKFIKHGYSKVTDQLSREIRHRRINKLMALEIAIKYEQSIPQNVNSFLEWMGMKKDTLNYIADKHINKFFQIKNNTFISLNKIHLKNLNVKDSNKKKLNLKFFANSKNNYKKYILFGKGY